MGKHGATFQAAFKMGKAMLGMEVQTRGSCSIGTPCADKRAKMWASDRIEIIDKPTDEL